MEHKETSLFDLIYAACKACGRGINRIICLLSRMIRLSWRKAYIVLPLLILGLAAGIYWTRPENRKYKVEAVLILNGPTEFDVAQALMPIEFAVDANMSETQNLQNLLQLEPGIARVTTLFEHFPVIDFRHDSVPDMIDYKRSHKRSDTLDIVMDNRIAVRFRTKNINSVPTVQQNLLQYLNSQPQIQAAFEAKKADIERFAEFCRVQTEVLDSFIVEFYFNQGTGSQNKVRPWSPGLVVGSREVQAMHNDMFELLERRKQVTHELSLMTAPVVLDSNFALNPEPVRNPHIWRILFMLAGWIAGAVLAWLIEDRKNILAWLRS
ncbi:MAG: hypothetical protein MST03_01205 [Bacteroidales bacterium]|nr:hypothetical protein [Bacteroidales bacterium]